MPPEADGRRIRVLVVDDEPNHRRCLTLGLALEGFTVGEAPDAKSALEGLGGAPYDVAVVDVMMPGVNGIDLARRIRADFPRVRIVLMSAYHLTDQYLARAKVEIAGFIPKPYRLDELAQLVRTAVASRPSLAPQPIVPENLVA